MNQGSTAHSTQSRGRSARCAGIERSREIGDNLLEEIKKDIKYYARSYAKARLKVHIKGLRPAEAAKQIKLALDSIQV